MCVQHSQCLQVEFLGKIKHMSNAGDVDVDGHLIVAGSEFTDDPPLITVYENVHAIPGCLVAPYCPAAPNCTCGMPCRSLFVPSGSQLVKCFLT